MVTTGVSAPSRVWKDDELCEHAQVHSDTVATDVCVRSGRVNRLWFTGRLLEINHVFPVVISMCVCRSRSRSGPGLVDERRLTFEGDRVVRACAW